MFLLRSFWLSTTQFPRQSIRSHSAGSPSCSRPVVRAHELLTQQPSRAALKLHLWLPHAANAWTPTVSLRQGVWSWALPPHLPPSSPRPHNPPPNTMSVLVKQMCICETWTYARSRFCHNTAVCYVTGTVGWGWGWWWDGMGWRWGVGETGLGLWRQEACTTSTICLELTSYTQNP